MLSIYLNARLVHVLNDINPVVGLSPLQRLEVQNKGTAVSRPSSVNDSKWRQCQHLEHTIPNFDHVCRSIMNNKSQWKMFYETPAPFDLMASKFHLQDGKK